MLRLTGYELGKIWGQRRFLLAVLLLLALDFFLLWYTNLPDETNADLSAYKIFQEKINGMTEPEKEIWLKEQKETIEGIAFVQENLMFQGVSGEMGETLVSQAFASNPGVFEAYYDLYQSGAYLTLTDSFWQEQSLIEELYEEWEKCADYEGYLKSVQEAADTLSGIGIFGSQDPDSFSARNVRKSAADYAGLTAGEIRWMPGRAITGAMENLWTDLFLLLSVFFFTGSLILEEKEKGLFCITRSTRWGIGKSIGAKLTALWVHCVAMAGLLYGANFVFYGRVVGFGDLGAALQSVAAFRESCLQVSILQYIVLSIFTKGIVLFGFGALLTALCLAAEAISLPYGAGFFVCGVSYILYSAIPAASRWNGPKYLNLMGIMKTEHFYGGYLNFNLFGHPVSCMLMTWIFIIVLAATGIIGSVRLYLKGERLTFRGGKHTGFFPVKFLSMGNSLSLGSISPLRSFFSMVHKLFGFKPHASLLRHEGYKILIVNHAALILLVFGFLAGYYEWEHSYSLSAQETYYQNLMLQLEGELTEEKEQLLLSEQARYQEAFDRVSQIDRMVSEGEISEAIGENMKTEWYAVTYFYPSFVRAWEQYQQILSEGGAFLYDTGYLYLFGALGRNQLVDLLLLCCGVVLAFANAAAMEEAGGTWKLLGSTRKGKGRVLLYKGWICAGSAALLSLSPFVCRMLRVGSVYPLRGMSFSVRCLPYLRTRFEDTVFSWSGNMIRCLPVWGFLLLLVLSQAVVMAGAALVVFGLSCWRRALLGTFFLAALILLVPLVLMLLGFSVAEYFSIYPLYSWAAP